jgi:hypothetical protein
MLQAGFDPTIPLSERLQTPTLDRAATGAGFGRDVTLTCVNSIIIVIIVSEKNRKQ